jgi:hypothetical protein
MQTRIIQQLLYFRADEWLQTGHELVIEHLQIVAIRSYSAIANSHTICSSLQHVVSLLNLLCLYQSLPEDGFQQCPLFPCSPSYRLTTVP